MKTPKYTDLTRYPHGYTPAAATNVAKTIAREYARLKALIVSERAMKVSPIKRAAR